MRWLVLIPILATCALGQHDPIPAELRAVVDDLDHPDLEVRERASDALAANASAWRVLDRAFASPGLSPEQRLRLRRNARLRFFNRDLPGMGLSFGTDAGGVRVLSVVVSDQFEAHRALQSGDLVIAINDTPLADEGEFRAWILSCDPGDVLRVTFRRNGQVHHAPIRLGRFDDLDSPRYPDQVLLTNAWLVRAGRYVPPSAPAQVIDPEIPAELWNDSPLAWGVRDDLIPTTTEIALGGEPHRDADFVPASVSRRPTARPSIRQVPQPPADPRTDILRERTGLILAMQRAQLDLNEVERRLTEAALTPQDRVTLRSQKTLFEDRLRAYREAIARLDERLQNLR